MDVDELESVVDEMSEEGGDQIDALYDTVTLNKDTYNGFICRLREIARLAKRMDEATTCSVSDPHKSGDMAAMRDALKKVEESATEVMERVRYKDGLAFNIANYIAGIAQAALAKPPRNCDRLSADQVKEIFKSEMEIYLPKEVTDNDREIARRTAYGVIDALFAPYTEWEERCRRKYN